MTPAPVLFWREPDPSHSASQAAAAVQCARVRGAADSIAQMSCSGDGSF